MDGEKISLINKASVISLVLMLFLILGAASAADTDLSDIQNSNGILDYDLNDENVLESTSDDFNVLESTSNDDNKILEPVYTEDLQAEEGITDLAGSESEGSADLSSDDESIVASAEDDVMGTDNEDGVLGDDDEIELSLNVASSSVILNQEAFSVRLTDSDGNGIANKVVKFSLNGVHFTRNTDSSGYANLKLNLKSRHYTIYYMFNEKGYATLKGNDTFLLVHDDQPVFTANTYVAYKGFMNPYVIALSADGYRLANKKITLTLDGKTYYRTTDSYGRAILNVFLSPGKYVVRYTFSGEGVLKKASGCKTIIVNALMPITINTLSPLTMYEMVSTPYKVKVIDARGNPVKGSIIFRIKGKSYKRTIDQNGIASLNIRLPKGTYKIASYHMQDTKYGYKYLSRNIRILDLSKDNGFWLFGSDMNKVNLATLHKYGTKHIFLNYYAIHLYGKSNVEKFISKANGYGMKVHIWMQIFNDGKWISPVKDDGSYKYSLFNAKIKEAKSYAAMKGVAGIHMDYLRFPGTAYKHKNGVNAINYFAKKMSNEIHGVNSKLIVSAAVMPEINSNKKYYGQDIPTLSKYLDMIVPMVYKGNYGTGRSWIKSTTAAFVKQSNGAKILTGLQAYKSDSDVTKLSSNELFKDAKAAMEGGASGVVSFRWGVSSYINFANL